MLIDYVDAIYKMLKPGGVWINLGIYDPRSLPLLCPSSFYLYCSSLQLFVFFYLLYFSFLLLFFVLFLLKFFLLSSPSHPFPSLCLTFSFLCISSNDSITPHTTPNIITTSCTYLRAQVHCCTTG